MNNTKRIVLCALLVALSFVGANIKVFGTIAFDSLPAFLAVLVLGFPSGAIVAFLGHMLTALTSGFPYGILVHLIIAIGMILAVGAMYYANLFFRRVGVNKYLSLIIASLAASVVNGPVILICLVPILGKEVCMGLVVPLFTVAILNCLLASVVYEALVKAKVVNVANADV